MSMVSWPRLHNCALPGDCVLQVTAPFQFASFRDVVTLGSVFETLRKPSPAMAHSDWQ